MPTAVLSIRIRRELKEKMERFSYIDWRREIERFIEERIREEELKDLLKRIDEVLADVTPSEEPAWRSIRMLRKAG